MTAPTLCTVLQVREYIDLNTVSSSSKYTDSTIGSNIRAAGAWMERRTGRIFGNQAATTKKFTTNGKPSILLPGLRTATTVKLDGTALDGRRDVLAPAGRAADGAVHRHPVPGLEHGRERAVVSRRP